MPLRVLGLVALIISVGFQQLFFAVQSQYSDQLGLRREVTKLQAQLRRQEMKTQLAHYQVRDFQQTVAALLPGVSQKVPDYQKRTIASLVIEPEADRVKFDGSLTLFEKGKSAFRSSDFETAISNFRNLIENYPLSKHTIDAYFLLIESRFQAGDVDDCLDTIDTMVTLFPDHDLTGFALLRMGQIFQNRDRLEDAEQIYRLTAKEFNNSEIKDQATRLLKEISL